MNRTTMNNNGSGRQDYVAVVYTTVRYGRLVMQIVLNCLRLISHRIWCILKTKEEGIF